MKTISVFSIITLLILCVYTSCKKKTDVVDNTIEFDSLKIAETYYLFNNVKKPSCNLQLEFVYPCKYFDDKILKKMQSVFIEKFMGDNFTELTPELAMETFKKQYIDEFKRFELEFEKNNQYNKDSIILERDEEADETGYSYYLKSKNEIKYNKNNILSFVVEYTNYEGGAHGSNQIYAYAIDLTTGTQLKENQIFQDEVKESITKLIIDKILRQNNLSNPEDLLSIGFYDVGDILPNGNFLIEDKGITYFFNEDEIAPHVMGRFEVFLPYDEIGIYLKDDSLVSVFK